MLLLLLLVLLSLLLLRRKHISSRTYISGIVGTDGIGRSRERGMQATGTMEVQNTARSTNQSRTRRKIKLAILIVCRALTLTLRVGLLGQNCVTCGNLWWGDAISGDTT